MRSFDQMRPTVNQRPTLKLVTLPHIPVACNTQTPTATTTTTFRIDLIAEAMGIYRLIRYNATPTMISTTTRFIKGIYTPRRGGRQSAIQSAASAVHLYWDSLLRCQDREKERRSRPGLRLY